MTPDERSEQNINHCNRWSIVSSFSQQEVYCWYIMFVFRPQPPIPRCVCQPTSTCISCDMCYAVYEIYLFSMGNHATSGGSFVKYGLTVA